MFVLLGRDASAGLLVRCWAKIREEHGEDPEKVAEARACADQMDMWAERLGKTRLGTSDIANVLPGPKGLR